MTITAFGALLASKTLRNGFCLPVGVLLFLPVCAAQPYFDYRLRSLGYRADAKIELCTEEDLASLPIPPVYNKSTPVEKELSNLVFCDVPVPNVSSATAIAHAEKAYVYGIATGSGIHNASEASSSYRAKLKFIPPRGSTPQFFYYSVDATCGITGLAASELLLENQAYACSSEIQAKDIKLARPFSTHVELRAFASQTDSKSSRTYIGFTTIRGSINPTNLQNFLYERLVPHAEGGVAVDLPPGWTYTLDTVDDSPTPVSVTPAVSSGNRQLLTVTYSAPNGSQTLDVVNVLINNYLDGRQACYLAYSRPSNALYIVADNGDAGQISGKVMDRTGTVGNSQCSVALANSSATVIGNNLTLVLDMTFNPSFGGNKVIYSAARDADGNNSDWQTMGAYGVLPLPSTLPNPVGLNPSSAMTAAQTITFTYQDQTSATNLQTVWGLINTAIDGRGACYFAYYHPGNVLYLYPDNGDGAAAKSMPLTGTNQLGNSQCIISAQGSSVQATGNTLKLTLPITLQPGFNGFQDVWLAAQTLNGAQTSPWQALGAWALPVQ